MCAPRRMGSATRQQQQCLRSAKDPHTLHESKPKAGSVKPEVSNGHRVFAPTLLIPTGFQLNLLTL